MVMNVRPGQTQLGTNLPAVVVGAACFTAYVALSLVQWFGRIVPSFDLAIFTQAIQGWASNGWPIVDIKGAGAVQLGDHFSPVLILLAPIYRVFPSPLTLLVVQDALVALSVVVVAAFATKRLGRLSGALLGVAYGLSWGLQSGLAAQFHEYAFAVPILAFSVAAFLDEQWVRSAVWAMLLLTVKEDLGFTVFVLGILLFFAGQRKLGVIVSSISLAWTTLLLVWVIPSLRSGHSWGYWDKLDWSALIDGWETKLATILLIGAVTGFVSFFSSVILLIVPTLAWRFLSDNESYWGPWWHYSMILMPIVFLAAVDVLTRWRTSQGSMRAVASKITPAMFAGLAVALMVIPMKPEVPSQLRTVVMPASWHQAEHEHEIQQVLSKIPDGSRVASDVGLLSYVVVHNDVFWIGDPVPGGPQFVLLTPWEGGPEDIAAYAKGLYGHNYVTVYDRAGYKLAEMTEPN